jgi:hypothetical protein
MGMLAKRTGRLDFPVLAFRTIAVITSNSSWSDLPASRLVIHVRPGFPGHPFASECGVAEVLMETKSAQQRFTEAFKIEAVTQVTE